MPSVLPDIDPREQIFRLEREIERLGESVEWCRKIAFAARGAIGGGVVLLAAILIGPIEATGLSLMIAAILILWQMLPKPRTRRTSALTTVAVFGLITVLIYNLATTLLLEGYLGQQAQERSIDQIDSSGSLIVGGRPELAASIALFLNQPMGFGSGTIPTQSDILVAKTGMAAVGYQPNNGYVETFMFGGGFELHSVAGDLWALFGLPGLAFVILCLVFTVAAAWFTPTEGVFLCPMELWPPSAGPMSSRRHSTRTKSAASCPHASSRSTAAATTSVRCSAIGSRARAAACATTSSGAACPQSATGSSSVTHPEIASRSRRCFRAARRSLVRPRG